MANFKIVVSDPKTRKAYQKEVEQEASGFLGKRVGEKLPAASIGLEGYTLQVTGGSDKEGFPMRPDVDGPARKRIILTQPPGFRPERKGQRKRKSVRGNTISADIMQVNAKVAEHGKKAIEELWGVKPREKEAKEGKAEKPPETAGAAKEGAKEKPAEKPREEQKAEAGGKAEEKPGQAGQEKAEAKMGVKKLE